MASETDLKGESELPEFPKRADFDTLEEYQESQKKYYETHGLRKSEDFSEDEKKAIVEECTVNLVDPKVLAKKYHTTVFAVRFFVRERGLKLAPEDLSKYPDFPKKTDDMSPEEYQMAIKKYWKARAKKNYKANQIKKMNEPVKKEPREPPNVPSRYDCSVCGILKLVIPLITAH